MGPLASPFFFPLDIRSLIYPGCAWGMDTAEPPGMAIRKPQLRPFVAAEDLNSPDDTQLSQHFR
jgi:hypothetical protein